MIGGGVAADEFDETVGLIYRAVEEPGLWDDALDAILSAQSASTGSLNLLDAAGVASDFVCARGFSDEARRLYGVYYHRVDPLAEVWARPTHAAVFGHERVAAAEFERSEIWNDYSRVHLDAFHLLCVSFPLADGQIATMGLHRGRRAAPFDDGDKRRLDRLLPHLRGALGLRRTLSAAGEPSLAMAVLDTLELGIVVVRADGTVVFANASAAASPALVIGASHRPLATADPAAGRRLLALVRDAATGGPGGAALLGAPGHALLAALVTPLPRDLADAFAHRSGLALVALPRLASSRPGVAARLRELFGLTGAEAALAVALLAGQRPEEVAEARSVRISTIRFQLRAVLDKTGTRGQSDLVRLLGRLAPFRDDEAPKTN